MRSPQSPSTPPGRTRPAESATWPAGGPCATRLGPGLRPPSLSRAAHTAGRSHVSFGPALRGRPRGAHAERPEGWTEAAEWPRRARPHRGHTEATRGASHSASGAPSTVLTLLTLQTEAALLLPHRKASSSLCSVRGRKSLGALPDVSVFCRYLDFSAVLRSGSRQNPAAARTAAQENPVSIQHLP